MYCEQLPLFAGVSVSDVPQKVLDASADFGQAEVTSYLRFADACDAVIAANHVVPDFGDAVVEARQFLTGEQSVAVAAE